MLQQTGGMKSSPAPYVASDAAPRSVYNSRYVRPTGRPGYPTGPVRPVPRPPVPAGRGPGGAGALAAILGPIGGLTGCLCCLNTLAVWGLFITAIPLTVYMSRWLRDYKTRFGLNAAPDLVAPQFLLLVVLVCSFLFTFMRRS